MVSELFELLPNETGKLTADFDLAVSKLIVNGLGGKLYFYNKVNEACLEFILELPKLE